MNWRIIAAIVGKDLTLFFRNRFFAFVTILALLGYIAVYFAMPGSVNEELKIGFYATKLPPAFEQVHDSGLAIEVVGSQEALRDGVTEGQFVAGVALPPDFMHKLLTGQKPQVDVYFTSDAPDEIKDAVTVLIQELVYLQSGQTLTVEVSEEILGRDMVGMQIPPRDRLLPLFAVLILMVETLGLASLISDEVERRTIQAILITPLTVRALFVGKAITGVGLAFAQAVLFMAATGGLSEQPLIVLITLLLGALLATGVGFLIASVGKDLLSVMAWGIPAMLILSVPPLSIMFPGSMSDWVRIIPSYYLVHTVHLAANFGIGWEGAWNNLMILAGFDIVIVWLGITILKRKLQ